MIKGLCFFVFGSLFATGACDLSPPFSYLSNVDRHHAQHHHGHHKKGVIRVGNAVSFLNFNNVVHLLTDKFIIIILMVA